MTTTMLNCCRHFRAQCSAMPSGSLSVAILLATADSPARLTRSTFASSQLGARSTTSTFSRRGGRTSSASAVTSRSVAAFRATVARRLCTVAGFYRYAVEEELLEHSPAVHVRRPRLDYESHVTGLDRNELGALLVAAGLGAADEHALISLLALNGLRVSEATGADIEWAWPRTRTSDPHDCA